MQDLPSDILGNKEKCFVCKLYGHFLTNCYESHLFDFGDTKRCIIRKHRSSNLNNSVNSDKKALLYEKRRKKKSEEESIKKTKDKLNYKSKVSSYIENSIISKSLIFIWCHLNSIEYTATK